MDSILKSLFGGQDQVQGNDNSAVQPARNFVDQYEQGGNVSDQAVQHYQQVAQQVPPDVYQRAAEQALAQMDPSQRRQFLQLARQQPGVSRRSSAAARATRAARAARATV